MIMGLLINLLCERIVFLQFGNSYKCLSKVPKLENTNLEGGDIKSTNGKVYDFELALKLDKFKHLMNQVKKQRKATQKKLIRTIKDRTLDYIGYVNLIENENMSDYNKTMNYSQNRTIKETTESKYQVTNQVKNSIRVDESFNSNKKLSHFMRSQAGNSGTVNSVRGGRKRAVTNYTNDPIDIMGPLQSKQNNFGIDDSIMEEELDMDYPSPRVPPRKTYTPSPFLTSKNENKRSSFRTGMSAQAKKKFMSEVDSNMELDETIQPILEQSFNDSLAESSVMISSRRKDTSRRAGRTRGVILTVNQVKSSFHEHESNSSTDSDNNEDSIITEHNMIDKHIHKQLNQLNTSLAHKV